VKGKTQTATNLRKLMEKVYREVALENIPWNLPEPPRLLVEMVESGKIKPCRVVDLGCGAGNHAVWLAEQGFDVTGIDISREAVGHAVALASRKGVTCRFVAVDLLGDLKEFQSAFDLAYDWELLHHVFPEDRPRYLRNVYSLLRPGGSYFSICFSDRDTAFGGVGKYRLTPLGTTLYFSSENELRSLFEPLFDIMELSTVEVPGKREAHLVNSAWLRRK
jgi:2-polyprenyl-3-methyl-5-hydroxy-6-metoxy-1,4-benzoquinol methylase